MLIFFQCLIFICFVKGAMGDYCLMILVFVWSFISIKEVRNGYKGGGGNVFFAKYNFNMSYIFIKQNPIFLYNFCQKRLDTLHSFQFRLHFVKTFSSVSKLKATNCRVSDCYLTPTHQFSAISWRDQVNC